MKFLQILMLLVFAIFLFSTTIVNALFCYKESRCMEELTKNMMPSSFNSTDCDIACFYYKCVTYGGKVYEGTGCFKDFAEHCAYLSTETMKKVAEHITDKSFEYVDKTVMVVSCTEHRCVYDALKKMLNKTDVYATFGTRVAFSIYGLDNSKYRKCQSGKLPRPKYDDQNGRYFAEKVQCSTRDFCETSNNSPYLFTAYEMTPFQIQTCDACVYYRCTVDGSEVMGGYGCYEDFDKICQIVPTEVKTSIKKNIKSSFHYDKNYIVVTCSNKDDCAADEYRRFMDVHPFAKFYPKKSNLQTCESAPAPAPTHTPPDVPHAEESVTLLPSLGSTSLQINIWMMLFGVVFALLGFIF